MFLRNVVELLPDYTASHTGRQYSSKRGVAKKTLSGEYWLWKELV
jgi:hypothetical protein